MDLFGDPVAIGRSGGGGFLPLGTIENDCMGGPCFPFMQFLGNGCVDLRFVLHR